MPEWGRCSNSSLTARLSRPAYKKPLALIISLTEAAAPISWARRRLHRSVTPAMGAKIAPRGSSMSRMFMGNRLLLQKNPE